jgi:hypothetical protein
MTCAAKRIVQAGLLAATAIVVGAAPSYGAGGYGPVGSPNPAGVPAAFESKVAVARTLGPSGGTLAGRVAHGVTVTVVVPPHTARAPVQVSITAPSSSQLSGWLARVGYAHYDLASGFGVLFAGKRGGVADHLSKPVTVTASGPLLGARGETVLDLTSATSARRVSGRIGSRSITFSLSSGAALLVANPATHGPAL